MKPKTVPVKNVLETFRAYEAIQEIDSDNTNVALLYGPQGAGKTRALSYLASKKPCVLLRARETWTKGSLLRTFLTEADRKDLIKGYHDDMFDEIVALLAAGSKTICIDEANKLGKKETVLELLRDLADTALVPLMLCGSGDVTDMIHRREREQYSGRVSEEIFFAPLDDQDTRLVLDQVCEVDMEDELLQFVKDATKPSFRRLWKAMRKVESWALSQGIQRVSLADWKKSGITFSAKPKDNKRKLGRKA